MTNQPTLVTVPCFSGARWDLDQLTGLDDLELRTMRLPEALDTIEGYADFLADQVADLDDYVLVGDSFGAIIALVLATRQPEGLTGLVLSGGFASDPVTDPVVKAKLRAARFLPGLAYRHLVLRAHAASLASPHDSEGQRPWTRADSRRLFAEHTPHASYVARARAAFAVDVRGRLHRVVVPTLVLTPSHDELIGPDAAQVLVEGIPEATEIVLPETGHMFRFSHPTTYATTVRHFLDTRGITTAHPADAAHAWAPQG